MRKFLRMAMPCLAVLTMAACSKKGNSSNTNPGNDPDPGIILNAKEQYLVGTWALDYSIDSLYSGTDFQNETYKATAQCAKDDRFVFNADRTYTKSEGTDTCNANGKYGPLSWSLNETSDYLAYSHGPDTWGNGGTFHKVDDTHFSVQATFYQFAPYSTKITIYYKKQ